MPDLSRPADLAGVPDDPRLGGRPDDPFAGGPPDGHSFLLGADDLGGDPRLGGPSDGPFWFGADDLGGDPPRPAPPRTGRDRLDDLLASAPSPGRVLGGAVAVLVLAVVGWRVLAPPPAPPEMDLPFAEQGTGAADPAGGGGPGTAGGGPRPGGGETAPAGSTEPRPAGEVAGAAGGAAGEGEVVAHVVGAVAAPGVRRLPAGARVVDAVDAAGGALPDADLARLNLAALVVDGQQVYVLRQGEVPPPPLTGAGGQADPSGAAVGSAGPVDVNRATADQLDELPGVGPATAEAIIAHREQHGPFGSVEDLLDVRGIGEAKLDQLRDLVTV